MKPFAPALVTYPAPVGAFDIHDDALMHDLMGNDRLAKPVQALFLKLEQIELTQASFGVDHFKALEALLPLLKDFRQACKEEWTNER